MVAHEHKGMDAPTRARTRLAEGFQEALPVAIIGKDGLAPVEHMIDRPSEFDACFASHDAVVHSKSGRRGNAKFSILKLTPSAPVF